MINCVLIVHQIISIEMTTNQTVQIFNTHFKIIMGRLKQALKAGFRHLIFEDNYDTGTGDHYSLRQICDQFYIRGLWLVTFLDFL